MAYSSLGYAAAYSGLAPCDHAWLDPDSNVPEILGVAASLWAYDVIFVSCAWELEIPRLVAALSASGVTPFRAQRPASQPLIVGGGPITLSNPDLPGAVCDAVFIGEADNAFPMISTALLAASGRSDALARLSAIPGMWIPSGGLPAPDPVTVRLPARPLHSVFTGVPNEFSGAFIVEVGRGCPRGCRFCVAFGGRNAAFYNVDAILSTVPDGTSRVGLLGAAVSDHPHLEQIVASLADRGIGTTLGSFRADRVEPGLVSMLAAGGLKTLTVAADGSSQRMRNSIGKGITEAHLRNAAEVARSCGIDRLRVYVMIGLPGETRQDVLEFAALMNDLAPGVHVVVSVSPFVPKRFTPLEGSPFAGVGTIRKMISELGRALDRGIEMRAGSVKQAEIEHRLSNVMLADAPDLIRGLVPVRA